MLDGKIGDKLTRIATGEIGITITQHVSHALETDWRIPKGRGIWFITTKYFATGNAAEAMYSTMYKSNLESFRNKWNMVIPPETPSAGIIENCYYEQIKDVKFLSEDIAHYDHAKSENEADGTYEFLYDSVGTYLHETRIRSMRIALP